ncbi:MAG: hypothetical protein SGJ10_14520 [Bacteroidota bacterium]|nr:hypothetical protein [Bacteroidota bacterium]
MNLNYIYIIGNENSLSSTEALFICGSPLRRGGEVTAETVLYYKRKACTNKPKHAAGNEAVDSTMVCPRAVHLNYLTEFKRAKLPSQTKKLLLPFCVKWKALAASEARKKEI